jgi:hypothetical protein
LKEVDKLNEEFRKLQNERDNFSHHWRKNGIKDVSLQILQLTLQNSIFGIDKFEL